MSKELEYIDGRIKDLEFKIEHPVEYNLTPTVKVKINDGATYKEEVETLKTIKVTLLKAQELESKLQRWYELLSTDGINSKQMVKNDIQYLLKGNRNQEDIVNEKKL